MLTRYKGQYNNQHRLNVYIGDCKEDMTAIRRYVGWFMCVRCSVLRLCSQYLYIYRQAHDLNISAWARRVCPRARVTRVCEWWVQLYVKLFETEMSTRTANQQHCLRYHVLNLWVIMYINLQKYQGQRWNSSRRILSMSGLKYNNVNGISLLT